MSAHPLAVIAWIVLAAVGALAPVLAVVLLVRAFRSRRLAELGPWHADRVPEELRAADYAARPPLDELLDRERRLMAAVTERLARPQAALLDRYRAGGRRAPGDRNLSFLLAAERPAFGALLLHGLSDSPYVMRAVGELFHRRGATVLGLRLPGHGTAPGGLLATRWQDWRAATEFGVAALRERVAERPLWIAGFSTGAALALDHVLLAAREDRRWRPAGLLLMAPAVELPWVARFALWHRTLAWLPYFTKFRWQEVKPEHDPCKYSSFPKRAGAEVFQLTRRIAALAASLDPAERRQLPPILAFQSLADDTVAAAGIAELLRRIGRAGDELVLFDLNRSPVLAGRLRDDEELAFPSPRLAADGPPPFAVTLVTNRERDDGAVEALTWPAGSRSLVGPAARRRALAERWPPEVFSLSHLALPVAPDDPLYGAGSELGAAVPRGERGVLAQPLEDLLRLRWNPFFDYMVGRMEERLPAAPGSG